MTISLIISLLTILGVLFSVLFYPTITIASRRFSTYWIVAILGAILVTVFSPIGIGDIWTRLTQSSSINPLKILTLFISTTTFSVFLDKVGFFRYLANSTLKRAKYGQVSLFVTLYFLVSVLTVFTSNDIVILTFTPFICYFTRSAKIDPIPYLITEFVAANTWSMALIIGNPTNIYVATANNIDFIEYIRVMAIPTIVSALSSLGILYLLFRKALSQKISPSFEDVKITDRGLLIIGLVHLILCISFLVLSSTLRIEMWLISLGFAISLFVSTLIYNAICRRSNQTLGETLKSAPWETVPFVLSMSILIATQEQSGVLSHVAHWLEGGNEIFSYGFASFFASNIVNNIPMSILFASILEYSPCIETHLAGAYSVIIGSNIGALLSPLGALAGVMWSNILREQGIKFSFLNFVRYGVIISIPTMFIALVCLYFML